MRIKERLERARKLLESESPAKQDLMIELSWALHVIEMTVKEEEVAIGITGEEHLD